MKAAQINLIAAVLLLAGATGCASKPKPPCCRESKATGAITGKSLYQLDSTWTSDVGRRVKLEVFRGRPQVLAMFFTSCEFSCPIIVQGMKQIQESLPHELREQVDFVLVTFDTERDTPPVLHAYRRRQGLGVDHWTLLCGQRDDVRELAALLGISYQKDSRGQFAHSNVITVLNAEGEVAFQETGLNQAHEDMIKRLTDLLSKRTGGAK